MNLLGRAVRATAYVYLALCSSCIVAAPAPRPPSVPAASTVVIADIVGTWHSSAWGHMVLRQVGSEIWGAYDHDGGTVVGTYDGVTFRGWWTERSRMGSSDSGEVEFAFTRDATGQLMLDGRYTYGVGGAWHDDWDLQRTTDPSPPDLSSRFSDSSSFVRHP